MMDGVVKRDEASIATSSKYKFLCICPFPEFSSQFAISESGSSRSLPQMFNIFDPLIMSVWPSEIRTAASSSIKYQNPEDAREEREGSFWFCESRQAWCSVKGDEERFRGFQILAIYLDTQMNSVIRLDCRSCYVLTFCHIAILSLE
jgi:hypothetical protein